MSKVIMISKNKVLMIVMLYKTFQKAYQLYFDLEIKVYSWKILFTFFNKHNYPLTCCSCTSCRHLRQYWWCYDSYHVVALLATGCHETLSINWRRLALIGRTSGSDYHGDCDQDNLEIMSIESQSRLTIMLNENSSIASTSV